MVYQERFKGVSRKIEWCFKRILIGFQGYLKKVQREFQERVFQGSFKGVSRKFQVRD